MSDAAAAQLRRILALVPELADDEEHSIDSLAELLGTDRATLLADLRSLSERYDPGGFAEEGVSLFIERERVSVRSPHFRRPMRLTSSELCALELGLAMLEAERPPEERSAIARARERLREVIARLPSADEDAATLRHATLGVDSGHPEHLAALRHALRAGRKLRLRYRRGDSSDATERVVRVYSLVVASGAWYAAAFCERSEDMRVFRLDRVESADPLPDSYTVPADFSVDAVLHDRKVLAGELATTMTVRYSPRIARWIAEREGRALDADGSLTMEHPLLDTQWGVRHVLQYGPDAEVLRPEGVRAELARRLGAMAVGAPG